MTFVQLCMIGIHKSPGPVENTAVDLHVIKIDCFTRKLFQVCTSIFLLACERVSFWLEGSISYRDSPDLQLCVDCFLISIRDPSK